jgi:hypothetical protein
MSRSRQGDPHANQSPICETDIERNACPIVSHFGDFVNKKHLGAIDLAVAHDFMDHDGPGGKRSIEPPAGR